MKIIVFDDDPTGSQTVSACPLLLSWDQKNIRKYITDPSPLMFILANTRSVSAEFAASRTREICRSLIDACHLEGLPIKNLIVVSRGDSTLRGHGVIEPKVIAQELGPFDATFHVPAFLEGGRTTKQGVHYLNGLPVHKTPFAKDRIFGYSTSDVADWLEEKSGGEIMAKNVFHLGIDLLERAAKTKAGMNELIAWLSCLSFNRLVVVDAESSIHLAIFSLAVRKLLGKKRFLFRSAASLINGLANIPSHSSFIEQLPSLRILDRSGDLKPGLVMVGSHVQLADSQLTALLEDPACEPVELPVNKVERMFDGSFSCQMMVDLESQLLILLRKILSSRKTPVFYTSRGEISFDLDSERMSFGIFLAEFMARIVAQLIPSLGYIISKGGITTQMLLSKGLGLQVVDLKGQILPGLSVVLANAEKQKVRLPIITFPGNLGDVNTLLRAWELMENIK